MSGCFGRLLIAYLKLRCEGIAIPATSVRERGSVQKAVKNIEKTEKRT